MNPYTRARLDQISLRAIVTAARAAAENASDTSHRLNTIAEHAEAMRIRAMEMGDAEPAHVEHCRCGAYLMCMGGNKCLDLGAAADRLSAMGEPDTSDIPEAGPEWFANARRVPPMSDKPFGGGPISTSKQPMVVNLADRDRGTHNLIRRTPEKTAQEALEPSAGSMAPAMSVQASAEPAAGPQVWKFLAHILTAIMGGEPDSEGAVTVRLTSEEVGWLTSAVLEDEGDRASDAKYIEWAKGRIEQLEDTLDPIAEGIAKTWPNGQIPPYSGYVLKVEEMYAILAIFDYKHLGGASPPPADQL